MIADNLTFLIKNIVGDSSLVGGTVSQRIGQVWNTGDIPFYAEKYKEITSRVVSSNAKHVASSASMSSCLSENNIWYLCFTIDSNGIIENVKEIKAISERENMYPTTISITDNFTDTFSYLNKYKQVINSLILLAQSIGSTIYAAYISPINQEDAHGRQISIVSLRELTQLEITQISSLLTSFRIHELVKQLTCESIKSAKAAIMSRNMSHNLGSHVMAYLKQNLGTVQDMLNNKALSNLVDYDGNDQYRLTDINRINDIEMPFLVGVGKFIKYLQERQDFIATVATGFVPYMSSVNFKDYIYDELNTDLRFLRHKKDRSGCMPSNILLDNIAKSEGYSRKNINISFRSFDGGLSLLNGDDDIESIKNNKDLPELRNINVSLPGGVIGRQAIFSIVENVIRNAAKHGRFDDCKKELILNLDVLDLSDPEVRKNIQIEDKDYYDLLVANKYFDDTNSHRYLLFSITNNQIVNDSIVDSLRSAILEPYIEDGKMKNTNKGIKEMRISACWLRDINDDNDISQIIESGEPPIILADCNPSNELRFTFCLRKPLKVAYVGCDLPEFSNQMTAFLNSNCWHRYDEEAWYRTKFVDYEIIIVDNEATKRNIASHSPNRIVILSNALESLYTKMKNSDESDWDNVLEEKFSSYWESYVQPSATDHVYIEDDITVMREPTGEMYVCESNYYWIFKNKVFVVNQLTDYGEISVLYRKHHSSLANLQSYYASIGKNYDPTTNYFVEGITGHNSTDRLIRNEKIDDLWYFRHIHAAKTKVAIFDERIFRKLSGHDESDILNMLEKSEKVFGNTTAIAYLHKRIHAFTIIPDKNKSKYTILGFDYASATEMKSRIIKIGEININTNGEAVLEFSTDIDKRLINEFDYVSVHQGLLDKVYEGILKSDDETFDIRRCGVTTQIRKQMCNSDDSKILIHSGRSMPSERDMPQRNIPFVQYATIENALDDAKLTLVDLLDFARCD